MTQGGDARILLGSETMLNRYHSGPYPRDLIAFASSTANDLSADAMEYLAARFADDASRLNDGAEYEKFLGDARRDIRAAYDLDDGTDIFFAASGTDLEYVALLAAAGRSPAGICNLLLGSDEVGSGCIHSAAGKFFAHETPLGHACEPGEVITGFPPIYLGDFPVRNKAGTAYNSEDISEQMSARIEAALAEGQHPLIHIVHGSKTGLVLPHLDDIDALTECFGDKLSFVVDACQARITSAAIADYLARGIIVFLTGSKFMGGPPFSGFALLPAGVAQAAAPLASGMAHIFRRAEAPQGWAGRDILSDEGNAGLALRLAASLFELGRFQKLRFAEVSRVVTAFSAATEQLASNLGISKVASAGPGESEWPSEHPIEMQTLVTLDLSHDANGTQQRDLSFDDAVRIHKSLIDSGVRLGQPVRCVRLRDGQWGATLRVGLSMPQVCKFHALDDGALASTLNGMIAEIETRLAKLL
ncbi:MAG: hypothetical protein ABI668_13875 [Sphingorhabdus sp.]